MTVIDPYQTILDRAAPMLPPQPGAKMVSSYAYPAFFTLTDGQDVTTTQIDFTSPSEIGRDALNAVMNGVRDLVALQTGHDLLLYTLYQSVAFSVDVPNQICLPFNLGCFEPPFAGSTVTSISHYRLWVLSVQAVQSPSPLSYRPIIGALGIVGIILAAIVGLAFIAGIIQMMQGKIKWHEIIGEIKDLVRAPGENVGEPVAALAWPFAAMGLTMLAGSIILPVAMARAQVGYAGGSPTGGLDFQIGSPPPAPPPSRRR